MSKKDCDVEYKIHKLLLELKKENSNLYEPTKRILKYLYKTVKNDYFENRISSEYRKDKEDRIVVMISAENNLFEYFVDAEDGVLDNLISLCKDDSKYFDKFYSGIEMFLEMSENNLFSNYGVYKYVFNMYAMLKMYQTHHDFDSFSTIVDDLSNFFIESILNINNTYSSSIFGLPKREFVSKQEIIDLIVSIPGYQTNSLLRENLKEVLNDINEPYTDAYRKKYQEIFKCYKMLYIYQKENKETDPALIKKIEDDLNEVMKTIKKDSGHYGYNTNKREYLNYFLSVLLVGNRYDFFKEQINIVEPNVKFQRDILSQIKEIEPEFFDFLNKELKSNEDLFIPVVKHLFNSDTYYELQSKLDALKDASNKYKIEPKQSLQLVESLATDSYKEEIDGIVFSWPQTNTVNQINKPATILERTIALHKRLEYPLSEQSYREKASSNYYHKTIKDFVNDIQEQLKSNKNKALEEIKRQEETAKAKEEEKEPPKKQKGLGSIFSQFKGSN